MTVHISARLAWHDRGWNGHICNDPKANTYCVGQNSFLQEAIASRRDLAWEIPLAGKPCHGLDGVPPCVHSINAFGAEPLAASSNPPTWCNDGTSPRRWTLPAYTISTNTWEWDKQPTWSPDGSRIVFMSNRESGHNQLWIMDATGSHQHNLSNDSYNNWESVWIPDVIQPTSDS